MKKGFLLATPKPLFKHRSRMKNVKPEHPLPWGLDQSGRYIHDAQGQYWAGDEAYIVHACNAYPKLVGILKLYHIMVPDKEVSDLLKELGEL
jgi:hypothetical protein